MEKIHFLPTEHHYANPKINVPSHEFYLPTRTNAMTHNPSTWRTKFEIKIRSMGTPEGYISPFAKRSTATIRAYSENSHNYFGACIGEKKTELAKCGTRNEWLQIRTTSRNRFRDITRYVGNRKRRNSHVSGATERASKKTVASDPVKLKTGHERVRMLKVELSYSRD